MCELWIQLYKLTYLQRLELATQYAEDTLDNAENLYNYLRKIKVGHPDINLNVHTYICKRFSHNSNIADELILWKTVKLTI